MMLTDDEIMKVATSGNSGTIGFAHAIIAAYTDKLRAGVGLSEPDTHCWDDDTQQDCWSHSKDQLIELRDASIQAGYLRGLEDAKRVCEAEFTVEGIAQRCAAAIQKLKGGE